MKRPNWSERPFADILGRAANGRKEPNPVIDFSLTQATAAPLGQQADLGKLQTLTYNCVLCYLRKMKKIFTLMFLVVAMPTHSQESSDKQFEAANLDFQEGRYETALEVLVPLAESGNAEAQHVVGTAFVSGAGVVSDAIAGLDWFLAAAEQGLPQAETAVAEMLSDGVRVA